MILRNLSLFRQPCLTMSLSGAAKHRPEAHEENQQDSTVDDEEIRQHSKLASLWWNEKGEMKGLHSMNRLRVPLIRDGLINTGCVQKKSVDSPLPLSGLKILDVGCGGGILTEPLARIGAKVTGIDASPNLIETARIHASQDPSICSHIEYINGTIEDHAETHKEYYDAVVASEVLEHVTKKDLFLSACTTALKPGGSCFVTTLNKTLPAWLGGIIAAEYVLKLLPQGTHDWNKFISPKDTQILFEKYDCSTVLVHGMFYNFLLNDWYWVPVTSINFALQAVKRKASKTESH